jgi:PKD repeat protein
MTGSSSLSSSIFSPGGPNKRWLTPGPTPPGWISPGPPCTVSNSHGIVSVFVEIDGVMRETPVNEDCSSTYDTSNGGGSNGGSFCDTTFNIFDPAIVPNDSSSCSSSTDPTCYGKIHSEIDRDWKAAHYCGSSTTCDDATLSSQVTSSTLLDVQGYVYWDPDHLTSQWHNFNGWEIHPLTAWRVHQSNPGLSASFSFSPTSPTTGQTISFTGSASGGTSPYTFNWAFGDGATGIGNPVSHSYAASGTYTVLLTVKDSTGATASTSQALTVTQPATPDFTISSSPASLRIVPGTSGSSKITLSSQGGFSGTITLSTNISPSGPSVSLNPTSLTLSSGGTGTSTLTVSTQSSTPLGNYTAIIKGTDGSLSHSTTVQVSVSFAPDFSISANPSSISISRSSSGNTTLSLASLNGFSGTVNLSVTVSPSGPKASLSSSTVTLTPGGSGSDLLTIRALKKTPVGAYTVTVTATSGTTTHTTTITVNVT